LKKEGLYFREKISIWMGLRVIWYVKDGALGVIQFTNYYPIGTGARIAKSV